MSNTSLYVLDKSTSQSNGVHNKSAPSKPTLIMAKRDSEFGKKTLEKGSNQYSQYSCPVVMWHIPVTERQNTDYQLRMWTDCSVIWHAWGKAHHLTCIISQTKCYRPRPRKFADISRYCSREMIIQTQFYQNLLSIFLTELSADMYLITFYIKRAINA